MFRSTVEILRCPKLKRDNPCQGSLELVAKPGEQEIAYGELICKKCKAHFPILAGVAILVNDVRVYLLTHVKGVSKFVPDSEIPKRYREEYLEYKNEIQEEHIEEDLESDRVNALYLMNHYLDAKAMSEKTSDPLMRDLLLKYWDQNPFSMVMQWVPEHSEVLELGCGVGGLYRFISNRVKSYLGVDSSFQSILIARSLNLGLPFPGELKTPKDLLFGNLSEPFTYQTAKPTRAEVDFVVGDIDSVPLKLNHFDLSISLNAIDMLEEPKSLPMNQKSTLKANGIAIQSGPYIWHEKVSKRLRATMPKSIQESGKAVEWLYESSGFKVVDTQDHLPWLFFKHGRQLEIYSVHLIKAQKKDQKKS